MTSAVIMLLTVRIDTHDPWRGTLVIQWRSCTSRCHSSKISGSQRAVVLHIWQKKTKAIIFMTLLCMIALRNTTVAHCLPSFDNEMSRKIVKSKKFCYHGNMASHFSSLFCSLDHPSATISCPVNAPWLLWLATLDLILMMYNHALWLAVNLGAQWINRVIVLRHPIRTNYERAKYFWKP